MRPLKVLLLSLPLLGSLAVEGACVASRANVLETYADVQLVPQGFPAGSTAVDRAMAMWNASGCNVEGTAFPWFQLSGGAARTVNVHFVNGPSTRNNICGSFSGNDIYVHTSFRDAASGSIYPCPPGDSGMAQTVAHELGHLLGLDDVSGSTCASYIMSEIRYSNGTYNTRSVRSAECSRAASINDTPAETSPDPGGPTGPEDPTVCHNCGASGPEPLLLDLEGDGVHLSGLDDPVLFDLDGDGLLDLATWTARGSDDAFLFLDRDHDRSVDGAGELFGSVNGRHSFEALQKLDWIENGGNDDGVIDHRDRAWASLRLWIDRDHDGISAADGEILTLQSVGIKRLELTYVTVNRLDTHGNRIDFRGTFVRRSGSSETYWDMYGVTFQLR